MEWRSCPVSQWYLKLQFAGAGEGLKADFREMVTSVPGLGGLVEKERDQSLAL